MIAITVLNKANVPEGPFTREQIAEKLRTGECALTDLAFTEGLSEWTPLGQVLVTADAKAAPILNPLVPAPGMTYSPTVGTEGAPPHGYAGFWLRVAAILVDGIILSPLVIVSLLLKSAMNSAGEDSSAKLVMSLVYLGFALFAFVLRWLYFSLLESSPWQATVGKKVLGLQVTTLDGQRIGFGRATGRYFGKIISAIILCIGFMMAGFTERKQALHDMMAGTLVIRK